MDMSSSIYVRESEIIYKTKEAKELQMVEAQNLKLPKELDHLGRSLLLKPKLPRLQKVKRHSVPKGEKL